MLTDVEATQRINLDMNKSTISGGPIQHVWKLQNVLKFVDRHLILKKIFFKISIYFIVSLVVS